MPSSNEQFLDRLAQLELRVTDLEAQVVSLAGALEAGRASVDGIPSGDEACLSAAIPDKMRNVIRLLQSGDADAAQQELRSIPEEELAEDPAAVAIVAAALCAQRGDMTQALKALDHAKGLTNDERLLRVMERIRTQLR